jgi:hypothetical protein
LLSSYYTTQSWAYNPPHYPVVRSLRVTRILDMFKIVNLRRTIVRLI